jgi:hypothetical protein
VFGSEKCWVSIVAAWCRVLLSALSDHASFSTGARQGLIFFCGGGYQIFFLFWPFLIIILEMNSAKCFFPNLDLLSHANPSGATYEGVTPVHLARLKVLACVR